MDNPVVLIIISTVLIPAIPALIIAVYVTNRNSKHISVIFERIDKLKSDKANESDMKELWTKFHEVEVKYSELFGRLSSSLDRLENIERNFEKRLEKA